MPREMDVERIRGPLGCALKEVRLPTNLPQRRSKPVTRMLIGVVVLVLALGLVLLAVREGEDDPSRHTTLIDD